MDKKEAAKCLYLMKFPQKEISKVLETSEVTISKWVNQGGWKKKRADSLIQKQTSEETIWKLIDYQLMVIEKITVINSAVVDNEEDVKSLKSKLIDRGDIDALQKLFCTLKGGDINWEQKVKVIRLLTDFIGEQNPQLAAKLVPIANEFINHEREKE